MIIDISKPESDFNSHLSLPSNERILFSGGFGTGKTYFLNEFFNSTNRNCEALHLYPVNYSVASNEDIFELIKFDIIIELFKKQITLKKISFDKFLTAQFFTQNKIYDIVNILIENTVKVSKSLVPVASVIIDLKKKTDEFRVEFENFHKECQTDEEKLLLKHLEAFANQKGTIYEEDSITLLIRELIDQLKLAQKEVILIVDDLDRIDPEHIFRLLNVFFCTL
ncbi:MAG: KAP family NTPase [Sporocytophaga sp.]|nr:KAP family NTPase [Sporocytophaga sp.]